MTEIEWTDKSWNPVVGCSIVSPGCTNCYAMRMAARLEAMGLPQYRGLTQPSKAGPVWTGKLALASEETLLAPLRRKKPTTYFVNSMGDLFHEKCPDEWINKVFAIMALCPQHTFQILTKRAERMRSYLANEYGALPGRIFPDWIRFAVQTYGHGFKAPQPLDLPLPNVWLGISAEDQARADERIPHLMETPAAVRFVSAEPLLGPINLCEWLEGREEHGVDMSREVGSRVGACIGWRPPLDWVIAGGESGPGARPMHPAWVASLLDQCRSAEIPFFFKQWGAFEPIVYKTENGTRSVNISCDNRKEILIGGKGTIEPLINMRRVGKKRAGRLLDGRTWDEMPRRRH